MFKLSSGGQQLAQTPIDEAVGLSTFLDWFETAMLSANREKARDALRRYLYTAQALPLEGSLTDAIADIARQPAGRGVAAALVLRALSIPGVIHSSAPNLVRSVVDLVGGAIPELLSLSGADQRRQNFEKFAMLEQVHSLVLDRLQPLTTVYGSIDSVLASKAAIMNCLRHPLTKQYCAPFRVAEVAERIDTLLGIVARVQKVDSTLSNEVAAFRVEAAAARSMATAYPSFLTSGHLVSFIEHVEAAVEKLVSGVRARFRCTLVPLHPGPELPKRYPLHEPDRELQVLVPMRNLGPGSGIGVTFRIATDSQHVLIDQPEITFGNVPSGEFAVSFRAVVVDPCHSFPFEVQVSWGELGNPRVSEDVFGVEALAQRSDVDWARYKYFNPYAEAPASGSRFIGRQEQVATLVTRMLQTPMQPTYVDGQKRVGKTSLAQVAADQAARQHPDGKLHRLYILWGNIAAESARDTLRNLGREIEEFILGGLPASGPYERGNYEGTLAPLLKLSQQIYRADPDRRFVIVLDEFDDISQEFYLQGSLAETFFANVRAITATPNICLLLVGSENMPYIMDRQGQKLNRFSRVNLSYFSRVEDWPDFQELVRFPSRGILHWHLDAVSEVFNLSSGNPYFAKIICREVMARSVRERDADVTAHEVRDAAPSAIARLESNQFAHMWQDGIYSPVEERETVALKRRRTLAALARCLRSGDRATLDNIFAHRNALRISEGELSSLLGNFVTRDVLVEDMGAYDFRLPMFRSWLMGVGLSRLANDRLSEELAGIDEQLQEEARVTAAEVVDLANSWPPYRGVAIGPERIRRWLEQRGSQIDQRLLFTILKSLKVVSVEENLRRLRTAGQVIRDVAGVFVIKRTSDTRGDVVITYVDGEGKSGQRYASDLAEECRISRKAILPPSSFQAAFRSYVDVGRKGEAPRAIVIVDDVVATGASLSRNVARFVAEHSSLLGTYGPKVIVYSMFATEQGMDRVRTAMSKMDYPKVEFHAGEILDEDAFAFAGETGVFGTKADRGRAKALVEDVGATVYPDNPLGYGGQGLLLVMPNTVPNNSLPILHSAGRAPGGWRPLFERIVN